MKVAYTLVLWLLAGCFAEQLTTPTLQPVARSAVQPEPTHVCIDSCDGRGLPPAPPYVMTIDGVRFRIPEDSARLRVVVERLDPDDIARVEVIRSRAASDLYATRSCPEVVVTTKRARQ